MTSSKVVIAAVGAVIIVGAGYFGAQQAGWIGAQESGMSEEDVFSALVAHAEEINAPDGLRYDDWSRLIAAEVDGLTIRITGATILDSGQIGADYMDSREPQAVNKICRDDDMRAISEGGATFVYEWQTADGEPLGTVTAGPDFCERSGA